MFNNDPPGPTRFSPETLPVVILRRYKNIAITVLAVILVSSFWLISGHDVNTLKSQAPLGASETTEARISTNKHSHTSSAAAAVATTNPNDSLIPHKIWQILLSKKEEQNAAVNPEALQDTPSWLALNGDYTYTLVSDNGALDFVSTHFADRPEIVETYKKLSNVGMKSDLLRYLLLEVEGGVYTDTDTVALKPINVWVPPEYRDKARLIVGIEFDRRDGGAWADISHWVQFCQWTIAAAPNHPVFKKMVSRVLESVHKLSYAYRTPIDQLHPSSFEVMNSTGPAAWTDVVFEQLQEYEPTLTDIKDLSFMTAPKLYGDILVLTIDGFGMGQPHSHSTSDGTIPQAALLRHLFRGSWREPEVQNEEEAEEE